MDPYAGLRLETTARSNEKAWSETLLRIEPTDNCGKKCLLPETLAGRKQPIEVSEVQLLHSLTCEP
eukprot:766748-Hanusia_phi.AAC.7